MVRLLLNRIPTLAGMAAPDKPDDDSQSPGRWLWVYRLSNFNRLIRALAACRWSGETRVMLQPCTAPISA